MSLIQRAYKSELALNDRETTACKRHAGAARWAYNWGLRRKEEAYRTTQAGHWYVSVLVEQEHVVPENTGPVVGVDLGLKRLATISDGGTAENPAI